MSTRSAPPFDRATVLTAVAAWMALTLLTVGVIAAAGGVQRVGYVMAVTATVVVLWLVVGRVGVESDPRRWPGEQLHRRSVIDRPPQTVDTRTTSIEANLRRGLDDPQAFAARVQPALRDLAHHRLRRAHGIDAAADPAAAREVLGRDLWDLLHEPRRSRLSVSRVTDAVARIEQIGSTTP